VTATSDVPEVRSELEKKLNRHEAACAQRCRSDWGSAEGERIGFHTDVEKLNLELSINDGGLVAG
jgi:hypothetical protein